MTATTILGGLIATVVGALFVQHLIYALQHRNWLRQLHISQQNRRMDELKALFVEFDEMLSKRVYRTRRLLYALRRRNADQIRTALSDYDQVLFLWNDKRNSLFIRLMRVVSLDLANEFEFVVTWELVGTGLALERLAREQLGGKVREGFYDDLTALEERLDVHSRVVYEFLREVYVSLQNEQEKTLTTDLYERIPASEDELETVSTWFLLRTLFIPVSKARQKV